MSDPWLEALRDIQQRLNDAHARFERTLAEGHARYLDVLTDAQRAILELARTRGASIGEHAPAPDAAPSHAHQSTSPSDLLAATAARVALPARTTSPLVGLRRADPIAVIADRYGYYIEVAAALREEGLDPRIHQSIQDLSSSTKSAIWCAGLGGADSSDEAVDLVGQAVELAHTLTTRWQASDTPGALILARETGGALGHDPQRPAALAPLGALDGLARGLSLHWPSATIASLDVHVGGTQSEAAARLVRAVFTADRPTVCGVTPDGHVHRRWRPISTEDVALLPEVAALATYLDVNHGIVLLSGTLPPAPLMDQLREGDLAMVATDKEADALYLPVQEGAEALFDVLADLRDEFGPVRAWIHGHAVSKDAEPAWHDAQALRAELDESMSLLGATLLEPIERIVFHERVGEDAGSVLAQMTSQMLRHTLRARSRDLGRGCAVRFLSGDEGLAQARWEAALGRALMAPYDVDALEWRVP